MGPGMVEFRMANVATWHRQLAKYYLAVTVEPAIGQLEAHIMPI